MSDVLGCVLAVWCALMIGGMLHVYLHIGDARAGRGCKALTLVEWVPRVLYIMALTGSGVVLSLSDPAQIAFGPLQFLLAVGLVGAMVVLEAPWQS